MLTDEQLGNELISATRSGRLNAVQRAIETGADVNYQAKDGSTPLCIAASNGNVEIVTFLLQKHANINQYGSYEQSSLSLAAKFGHLNIVQLLVAHGANLELQVSSGTALCTAIQFGRLEIVQYLVHHGANAHVHIRGMSCLQFAFTERYFEIVKFLIAEAKIDSNEQTLGDGFSALHHAIPLGDLDLVRFLINHGANVNAHTLTSRNTPLMQSICNRDLAVAEYLLAECHADIDAVDHEGNTALHLACWMGDLETVRVLVTHGADMEMENQQALRPVFCAAICNRPEIAAYLLDHGATRSHQYHVLHAAAQFGALDVASCLLQRYHESTEVRDIDGFTPLRYAVENGQDAMVTFLLHAGANADPPMSETMTLLDLAKELELHVIVTSLQRYQHTVDPIYSITAS